MVNNGSLHYDHDRDGTHTQLAGCEAKFRNLEHDTHIAIRYERDTLTGKCTRANHKELTIHFHYPLSRYRVNCLSKRFLPIQSQRTLRIKPRGRSASP